MERRLLVKVVVVSAASVVLTLLVIVGVAYATDIFTVDKDGTVRLVITDAGNVGIGTNSPIAPLHIEGNAGYGTTQILKATATGGEEWRIQSSADASSNGGGKLVFVQQGVATRMVVTNTGNVGVGTTDPKTKLHVTGLPEYADNAAAIAAGLTAGAFYRTGDLLKVVH